MDSTVNSVFDVKEEVDEEIHRILLEGLEVEVVKLNELNDDNDLLTIPKITENTKDSNRQKEDEAGRQSTINVSSSSLRRSIRAKLGKLVNNKETSSDDSESEESSPNANDNMEIKQEDDSNDEEETVMLSVSHSPDTRPKWIVRNPFYGLPYGTRCSGDKKKAALSKKPLEYSKWDFVVSEFDFADIKDTKVKQLVTDKDAVSQLTWNQFSALLTNLASNYYGKLSPYWHKVPPSIRHDLSVGLLMSFPWLQKRYRHYQKKIASGKAVAGAQSSSLDFNNLQDLFIKRIDRRRYSSK